MLTALGLPGGGVVSVGDTHVRVVPGSVPTPNELQLPRSAFDNGAGGVGQAVDVNRVVLPIATAVIIEVDGQPVESVPAPLVGVPVSQGDRFPIDDSIATVLEVHPTADVVLGPSTVIAAEPPSHRTAPSADEGEAGDAPTSTMVAGLENERDLLGGWLRLITGPDNGANGSVAGVIVTGPTGSGRGELVSAAAADADLRVRHIDLRTVTTPERLLSKFEGAAAGLRPGTLLLIDRLDPLLDRESGTRHQAAAVTRWLLDKVADTNGVAVVIASTRTSIGDELDAKDLLRRTLTIAPPDHHRRRALLEAAIGDQEDIDLDTLANATPGFSALDISTAVLEARATSRALTTESILEAIRSTPASLGTMQLGDVPSYGFERVANLVDVKRSLTENVIWQMTDPGRFERMGIEPAKGLLLYGPPGTGKTFVVRALAHESGAAFFSVKGAELLDKWVGESERGVREVFSRARSVAPAIIFFDEIDALAPVRGSSTNNVTDSVVAALLTEMDGVSGRGDVFVIGATNRRDLIDPALLRPGRLEVHLLLDLPAPEAREAFFSMTSVPLGEDVDRDELVAITDGRSFADLDGVLRMAAISAMRADPHATEVSWEHLVAALGSGD